MTTITWSQIEAECGDYRAGIVAIFRKYEGQDTDERTAQNKIVKVTVASFARHIGLTDTGFQRWIDREEGNQRVADHGGAARRFADKLPPAEKAKLVAELLDDPEVVDAPEVREAQERATDRRLAREEDDMRARGANPDFVEPFDGELAGEAVLIAQVIDGARHRVHRLLDRAEPDQRPPLIATVLKAYDRLGQALDAGSVKVPDYVPEDL